MAQEERIFGLHAVRTLLERRPQAVLGLTVQAGRQDQRLQTLLELARPHGIPVQTRAVAELDAAAEGGVHQGVVARVKPAPVLDENALLDLVEGLGRPAFLLVLPGLVLNYFGQGALFLEEGTAVTPEGIEYCHNTFPLVASKARNCLSLVPPVNTKLPPVVKSGAQMARSNL